MVGEPSLDNTEGAGPSERSGAPFSEVERKRLEWRCRRGMKELDLLLVRYLKGRHAQAPAPEQLAFEQFLALPDPEIARYLVAGDAPDDPQHAELCRRILQSD
jgi:antitoxin CptB